MPKITPNNTKPTLAEQLVRWQLAHGRHALPWQNTHDAYRIWLSEIMLQQTQVITVLDYYQRFLTRFPTVADLARAEQDDVLAMWAGLGYYSRARNLHTCAQTVVNEFDGVFPNTSEQLQTLKGIGASTAAAIAVFAYAYPAPILDGNVKRILSRVYGIDQAPSAQTDKLLWQKAHDTLVTPDDAQHLNIPFEKALRAYTQGVMDLGASLCSKLQPECTVCPWQSRCIAHAQQRTDQIPAAKAKIEVKTVQFNWYVYRHHHEVWVEQQAEKGIWAKLWAFPQVERIAGEHHTEQLSPIKHRLTHRALEIQPYLIEMQERVDMPHAGQWLNVSELNHLGVGLPKPASELLRQLAKD